MTQTAEKLQNKTKTNTKKIKTQPPIPHHYIKKKINHTKQTQYTPNKQNCNKPQQNKQNILKFTPNKTNITTKKN